MSKTEIKQKKEAKRNISIADLRFGLHNDTIDPIATLVFPDSEDRGFEFRTSNLSFTFRLSEHDYYNLIDTLFEEVYDEYQERDDSNPMIEDFRNFLIAKITGEI
ncbi:MAG: hypothetical protein ACFFDF_07970 [Candidatus Odinarchaeota archaeon]